MNCIRCNLELFDDRPKPVDGWTDKVWDEGVCYLNGSHHRPGTETLNPPHIHPSDIRDEAVTKLCEWVNAQSDAKPGDPDFYTAEYYTSQVIRHVDTDAGILLLTLDPMDEGGPAEVTVYYETWREDEVGELRMLVIDFDLHLTALAYTRDAELHRLPD